MAFENSPVFVTGDHSAISARTSSSCHPPQSRRSQRSAGQLRHWLDRVANLRVHATTRRVVNEAFAEEKASLQAVPMAPYRAVLRLERRASHQGMVSVGGNLYRA